MTCLFSALAAIYTSAAQCAAALGISRQAYSQAIHRRRLSEQATIRAAALLNIDPAAALLANATRQDVTAPVSDTTPHPPQQNADVKKPTQIEPATIKPIQIMRGLNVIKKAGDTADMKTNIHKITSQVTDDAIDLIKWVLSVAKLFADSPRFVRYVSRCRVPEKIATAKKAGYFLETIANCPPIDLAWVSFVPAALAAYADFVKPDKAYQPTEPTSLPITHNRRKLVSVI